MKPLWILQNNGIDRITARIALELRKQSRAFVDVSVHDRESFEEVVLSRIAEEGFEIGAQPLFFYGSVLLLNGLSESHKLKPYLHYTAAHYEAPRWVEQFGSDMLNAQVQVCALKDIFSVADPVFIRPYCETKLFTGSVVHKESFAAWLEKASGNRKDLNPESLVCASPIKTINAEWRIFCREGVPLLWSQYKRDGQLSVEATLPEDALEFARKVAKQWTPDKLCTLDLAQTQEGSKIIEFNGIHCCGIYAVEPKRFLEFIDSSMEG